MKIAYSLFLSHFALTNNDCLTISNASKALRGDGLHRTLTYRVELAWKPHCARADRPRCDWRLLDRANRGFYVDREEVGKRGFGYRESAVMDIEKMTSEGSDYEYALVFEGRSDSGTQLISADLPFHLRYPTASYNGKAVYTLSSNFRIVSDCVVYGSFENVSDIKSPFFAPLIDEMTAIVEVGREQSPITLTFPTGNTSLNWFWAQSTAVLFLSASALLAAHFLPFALANAKAILLKSR